MHLLKVQARVLFLMILKYHLSHLGTSLGQVLQVFHFHLLLPSIFPLHLGSLFENEWSLKPEYKRGGNRLDLADRLASRILWIGIANLLLCPVILVWQILYAFFSYTEVSKFSGFLFHVTALDSKTFNLYLQVIKREPGSLGARCWSLYGRCYLRHFNELDHELMSRLSKGYKVSLYVS